MKEIAKKGTYIGIGGGLVLFAVIGLLPGSFLGGVIGLNIAGALFGTPVSSQILPRLIVGISMLIGVVASGVVFVVAGGIAGWLIGTAIEQIRLKERATEVKEAKRA